MFALTFRSVDVAIENANASLMQSGDYVTGSGRLGSPRRIGTNPAGCAEIYNSKQDNKHERVKGIMEDQKLMQTLALV